MDKIVDILTRFQYVFVPGQIIFLHINPNTSSFRLILILSESRDMEKLSNYRDWSWNLLPIIMTIDFLLLLERQLFEYHLVTKFIHVVCGSAVRHYQQIHMITSSANILRMHPSKLNLEISLLNSKNKHWALRYAILYVDIQKRKKIVGGCEDVF